MREAELPDSAPGSYIPYGAKPYYLPETLPPRRAIEVGSDLREALEGAIYELS